MKEGAFLNLQKSFSLPHHAYLVEGDGAKLLSEIIPVLEQLFNIVAKGNPDFFRGRFETLGIDEARNLKELQEKKSFASDGRKIFVIEADAITAQAQNSLLKMFEEPTPNSHFFLIGNCVKNLIPTLASRLSKIRVEERPPAAAAGGLAQEFLSFTTAKRLAFVKKLSDDIKDEKKTKAETLALIHQIEDILYQKSKKGGGLPPKILEDIELCREYMSDRSASVKMLLEYIALIVPHTP